MWRANSQGSHAGASLVMTHCETGRIFLLRIIINAVITTQVSTKVFTSGYCSHNLLAIFNCYRLLNQLHVLFIFFYIILFTPYRLKVRVLFVFFLFILIWYVPLINKFY